MSKYLFVYGTLLPNQAPAEIAYAVKRLRVVGRGTTHGRLYDFGDFPGAVIRPSADSPITGLVYEIPENDDEDILRQLDNYEGFDERNPETSLFRRRKRLIALDTGRKVMSWVYEYNRSPVRGIHLPKGDYRDRAKYRKVSRIAGD